MSAMPDEELLRWIGAAEAHAFLYGFCVFGPGGEPLDPASVTLCDVAPDGMSAVLVDARTGSRQPVRRLASDSIATPLWDTVDDA